MNDTQHSPVSTELLESAVAEAISSPVNAPNETANDIAEALATTHPASKRQKSRQLVTAAAVSFSLTLLAGSFLVMGGHIPLRGISYATRADIGALLMFAPVCALILALLFEVARLVIKAPLEMPEPRIVTLRWQPGNREG